MECDNCGRSILKAHRIYKNMRYCDTCYAREFKKRICPGCGSFARLPVRDGSAVCAKCLNRHPCIRCGRSDKPIGKITSYGPVCNSCSIYFRPLRCCSQCGRPVLHLHKLIRNTETIWLCQQCDKETYGTCSLCHRYRKLTGVGTHGKKICSLCSIAKTTHCTQCHNQMPAGRVTLCETCTWLNTFRKRVELNKAAFRHELFATYYTQFSAWLLKESGAQKAAITINKHLLFFIQLDNSFEDLPSSEQLVELFGIESLRRAKKPVSWLHSEYGIEIDPTRKKETSEIQQINKMIEQSSLKTNFLTMIDSYRSYLFDKYSKQQTTLRSIRLALRPAISFFISCQNEQQAHPGQDELQHYLNSKPGQRVAITGFINFVNDKYRLNMNIKNIRHRKINHKQHIENQLISLLKTPKKDDGFLMQWVSVGLSYFHNQPSHVITRVSETDVSLENENMIAVKIADKFLWLPHWNNNMGTEINQDGENSITLR